MLAAKIFRNIFVEGAEEITGEEEGAGEGVEGVGEGEEGSGEGEEGAGEGEEGAGEGEDVAAGEGRENECLMPMLCDLKDKHLHN